MAIRLVGDREDVRRDLVAATIVVALDHRVGVDGEQAVRVDGDREEARVGLRKKSSEGEESDLKNNRK